MDLARALGRSPNEALGQTGREDGRGGGGADGIEGKKGWAERKEVLLRGIECSSDIALCILSPGGLVQSWNRGAEEMLGYEASEILESHFRVFHPSESIGEKSTEQELELASRNGRVEAEGWRMRKNGKRFWAKVVVWAVYEEGDGTRLRGFLMLIQDMTEQRQAQEHIRIMERGIAEIKDYAIFLLTTDGIIMTWNSGASHIKGYRASEVVGKHISLFYTTEDLATGHPENELETAKRTGRFEDCGWRVRKDGTKFWAHVVLTSIVTEEGQHVGFAKVTQDLTEKRLAEKKLQTLEMGTSEVKDYAFFLIDLEGTIQTWNRGAELTFRMEASVAIGSSFLDLCLEMREEASKLLAQDRVCGVQRVERQWHRKDGECIWADISTSFIQEQGIPSGYIVVAQDLTERKILEEERFNAVLKAELERKRAEDAKMHEAIQKDFTDRICHEIRNPLHGINGNVELISENSQKIIKAFVEVKRNLQNGIDATAVLAEVEALLGHIKEEAESIAECCEYQKMITDEVLGLSAIETKGLTIARTRCDPKKVMESVVRMHQASCDRKGVSLLLVVPQEDVSFLGDMIHVEQVIVNLVSNALRFTPSGGSIRLSLSKATVENLEYLQFSVQDTGCGMNEQEIATLFQRRPQGKATGYKEHPGSGLGLIISKHLVEAMGGVMKVDSAVGHGSTFSFLLPFRERDAPATSTSSEATEPTEPAAKRLRLHAPSAERPIAALLPDWSSKRILVVDDSSINQKVVTGMLRRTNCITAVASNGQEALEMIDQQPKEHPFDFILMDLTMPVMNGFEATKAIREAEKREGRQPTPIIALSGYTQERERKAAKIAGMDDYLSKPVKSTELLQKIAQYMAGPRGPLRRDHLPVSFSLTHEHQPK